MCLVDCRGLSECKTCQAEAERIIDKHYKNTLERDMAYLRQSLLGAENSEQ